MYSMDNASRDWDSSEDDQLGFQQRKTLLSSKDCKTIDDLVSWIVDDAQFQSPQYLHETKAECEGE
jgi:hypothetical protein